MPDRKEFIALFKVDAEELVTKLNGGIIALEKAPNRLELIKDLNMYAHTIKGSARVFGFLQIQEIAHKMEDVFDQVLKKKLKFGSSIANRIFEALDRIKILLGGDADSGKGEIDISDVCRGLAECLAPEGEDKGGGTGDKKDEKEPPALKQAQEAIEDRAEPAVEADGSEKKKMDNAHDATGAEEYIRVSLSKVNKLLNLSGEMAIHKLKSSSKIALLKRMNTLAKEMQGAFSSLSEMIQAILPRSNDTLNRKINQCHARVQKFRESSLQLLDTLLMEAAYLDPVIDELQGNMKEIRMLPLLTIFEGFPRMVRDIASQKGKTVNLEITGGETGIDKKVLDGIKAPLMHILRNSVDHGIEEPAIREKLGKPRAGAVKISAGHEGANVVIRIEDDGKGLDVEEIKKTAIKKKLVSNSDLEKMTEKEIRNIVFMNGYSSSPIITDISGRGIGLDIAIKEIKNLKGQILLDSENGKGTTFTLILPLTIAIIQVLLLKSQEKSFAIPATSVTEIITVMVKDISTLDGKMAIQVRDHTVPVVRLNDVLGLPPPAVKKDGKGQAPRQDIPVVIVSSFEKKVGFVVDEALSAEEVFIKSLGAYVGKVKNVSGAAILGTGEVVVILDVEDLLNSSRCNHPASLGKMMESQEQKKERRILVMDDVLSTRELEKNILESQGYTVDLAVDGIDGMEKITQGQYDLVVSDIEMPRMNGLEFCQNIRKSERYKDLPIVLVTALEKEEDKRRGIEVGASAYIVKTSFEQSNLLDTIERLIG